MLLNLIRDQEGWHYGVEGSTTFDPALLLVTGGRSLAPFGNSSEGSTTSNYVSVEMNSFRLSKRTKLRVGEKLFCWCSFFTLLFYSSALFTIIIIII